MVRPKPPTPASPREIPAGTIARLPLYLRALRAVAERGVATVSSQELAEESAVSSPQLRKDLSYFGSYGVRGVGYDVARLSDAIGAHIGTDRDWPILIVGMGNLGRALAHHRAGAFPGAFRVVGLVDSDPAVLGSVVDGHVVESMAAVPAWVERHGRLIAVLATPADQTQAVTDQLVAAGVRSFLNFAPVALSVPAGVSVRGVDLDSELQILAYHEQRRARAAAESTLHELDASRDSRHSRRETMADIAPHDWSQR